MGKMQIKSRLITSITIILIIMGVSGIVSILTMQRMTDSNNMLFEYRVDPLYDLDDVNVYFNQMTSNLTQIYIAKDGGDESMYKAAYAAFENNRDATLTTLRTYRSRLDSNPHALQEGKDLTDKAINYIETKYLVLANDILTLIEQGKMDEAQAAFLNMDSVTTSTTGTAMILELFNYNINKAHVANKQTETEASQTMLLIGILIAVSVILSVILEVYLIESIKRPVNKLKTALNEVADGNLNVNLYNDSPDEIGELSRYTAKVVDVINLLTKEISEQTKATRDDGDLDARIDSSLFRGAYKAVAEGINDLSGSFINDINAMLNALNEIVNGNFNTEIPKMPGKKARISDNFNVMNSNLKSIADDIGLLVRNASEGNLSKRADVNKYKGDWAGLLLGLNNLMEAVAAPINEAVGVLQKVSEGDFTGNINGNYHGDFLIIKNALNSTVKNVASYIDEISNVLTELANNNLDQAIDREYIGSFSNIKNAINDIIMKLNNVISNITAAAEQVAEGSTHVSESSASLASGTSEQAASVEELNATITIISNNTSDNHKNANKAKALSDTSKENAAKGDNDMKGMLAAMDSIRESSNNISKIIKVIEDIAFQTNLLALNAAVEAARAGEHGKGFAVVSEEVRNLAGRSQIAAKETTALIDESINRVNDGIEMAGQTANTFSTIVNNIDGVADIITNIVVSSSEQAAAIEQVSSGLSKITEVVQTNSSTSEETSSTSEELSSQADMLQRMIKMFKIKKSFHGEHW